MGYKNTQDKPGPQVKKSRNNVQRSGRSDGQGGPLAGEARGNRHTSNYQRTVSRPVAKEDGGRNVEGQKLRGYTRSRGRGSDSGGVKDATVGPDGTNRVQRFKD